MPFRFHPLILAMAGALASTPLLAAPQVADSRISAVTVYTDRAIVTRTATLQLPAGQHEIALEQLPLRIDDNSLQASLSASAAATLLDVSSAPQVSPPSEDNRLQQLDAQLRDIERQEREISDRGSVLENQKQFLADIQASSTKPGKNQALPSIDELKNLLQMSEGNLGRILDEQRKLDQQSEELQQRRQELENQRSHLAGDGTHYKRAILRVALEKPAQVRLQLSYTLYDASWRPAYDARLRDGEDKIEMSYQGIVRQSSGEDWTNVDLTLSTARPNLGSSVPALSPWFVDTFDPRTALAARPAPAPAAPMMAMEAKKAQRFVADEQAVAGSLAEMPVAVAEVSAATTSASFHIPTRATLNSDGSSQKVSIAQFKLPATFRYLATPSLREAAYLQADTRNASDYPLLPGTLNTYLGNTFVASGQLRAVMPGETFELALGGDEAMSIKRKLVNRYTDYTGLTGGRKRVTYEFRIDAQNNHKSEQRLQFKDQLPVSRNEQIKVALLEPEGQAIAREDDGKLLWDWQLKPGEKRSTTLKFSVEYPKELEVSGLD
ncbi:mucoidy inhibitor MuiA family protein [Pseudomonas sp. GD04087]|uniref:mucoidy inhibitor MuiA family protein n=1 Tax=unclassified Pseudomonas TaxID=196821 RepID=UPI00244CB313|nr:MULTISPECIES: mucoidy inhibitor MuiA family protein [unclassified Pseudomonas]MDH0289375.1 mucoidy inhibitor MuiA family protein [Pseudomonas sp. GD04087]MDH1051569.1 mucoidy inhibitor MuiA family protein [Pseudomonas sp. GD03903]MDH2000733.1 mucoidy inhibitor MuiA family protein [Pseudomonas sp. GD03691]